MFVQLFGKKSTPRKGMGVKSWGVLCLGIHGTWRTGGADAGVAASKEGRGRRGRFGICVLVQAPAVPVPKGPARGWRIGLQLMRGPWFVQGWLLRGEAGAPGGRSTLGKGVYTW